jgi:hypothetical protein
MWKKSIRAKHHVVASKLRNHPFFTFLRKEYEDIANQMVQGIYMDTLFIG